MNRLTRELSVLRAAQNASVVSNASSTSASATGTEPGQWGDGLGASHYQPVRHNRTSSSASTRSFTANVGSVSTTSLVGISSPAPVRPGAHPPIAIGGISLSRQNSAASRRSRAGSPSPAPHSLSSSYSHHPGGEPGSLPGYFNARVPIRTQSGTSTSALATPVSTATTTTTNTTTTASELSPGILPATSRYEETALRRAELDEVKRENEALRRRVRELERMVRDAAAQKEGARGQTPMGRGEGAGAGERPRAVSTMSSTGSVIGVGVPEEELRVGESAATVGRGRGRGRE